MTDRSAVDVGEFQSFDLGSGMELHIAPTTKFKRTHIAVFVHDQLDPERTPLGGLLPYVQKRGSVNHPDGQSLERAAGHLYDADLSGSVYKVGDRQLIAYTLEVVNDRYVDDTVFSKGLDLLKEVVYQPVTVDGGLHPDYVEQEKRFQIGRVRALINDKIRYAQRRCVAEMFAGEPFAEHELGQEEGIEAATPQSLLEHHRRLMATRPIGIYVIGDVNPEDAAEQVKKAFAFQREEVVKVPRTLVAAGEGEPRTVTQEEQMQQGWLVLGMRTDIKRSDPARYGMTFFNGILGGFVHSKLFINVREKASLAYLAASTYDATKGFISAIAGIDTSKYEAALDIIRKQIDDTREGRFTDEELEATRKALRTQLRMRLDSPSGRILNHVVGRAEGSLESVEEVLANVEKVGRDEIMEAGHRARLDMIYFLKGIG